MKEINEINCTTKKGTELRVYIENKKVFVSSKDWTSELVDIRKEEKAIVVEISGKKTGAHIENNFHWVVALFNTVKKDRALVLCMRKEIEELAVTDYAKAEELNNKLGDVFEIVNTNNSEDRTEVQYFYNN